jgi:hypothetical protein
MTRRWMLVAIAGAIVTIPLVASGKLESAGDVDMRALAVGPAGMKIHCKWSDLKADERDGKLVLTSKLTGIETGIGLRDKHLRGYLKTDKHPNAVLTVDKSQLKLPENDKTAQGSATGQLTLRGVTKPLKFNYRANRTGSDYHVQGLADLDIRHHDIEVPCYLGVCVEPVVKLKVKFKLRDR